MKSKQLIYFLLIIAICSCKKDELAIQKHNSGNVLTASVNMESNYKWQLFYDLETNSIIKQVQKTEWDLGFESSSEGYHIILNSAKAVFSRSIKTTDFESIKDTIGFAENKLWDEPSGNLDSTAIGDWRNQNNSYLIDRGFNEKGEHQGFRKIQFQSVTKTHYNVRFAELSGKGDTILQIQKDTNYNFQYLSFNSNQEVLIEPKKQLWDICFSQYIHVFYNPTTTYLVTGCLLNRYKTAAVLDSIASFESMNFGSISKYTFSTNINTIGYGWKVYLLGVYTTSSHFNYLIRNRNGLYFKLHFVDFYDTFGVKGNPKWEYQQL